MEPSSGKIAPGGGRFPPTRLSVVEGVGSRDPETRRRCFDALIRAYWRPVYKYLRLRWRVGVEEAEDLTQEFFARAFEKDYFGRYDPARARFRTFLRTCLDRFVANERQSVRRLKRGGGVVLIACDFDAAEHELRRHPHLIDDHDEYFRREWMRSLFGQAVEALRARAEARQRLDWFAIFERYDLHDDDPGRARPTYAEIGQELGVSVTDVTNRLAAMRRDFRAMVVEQLEQQCGGPGEVEAELRYLFGGDGT